MFILYISKSVEKFYIKMWKCGMYLFCSTVFCQDSDSCNILCKDGGYVSKGCCNYLQLLQRNLFCFSCFMPCEFSCLQKCKR